MPSSFGMRTVEPNGCWTKTSQPRKHLAPSALAVPDIAFIMTVIGSSVRHELGSGASNPSMDAAKIILRGVRCLLRLVRTWCCARRQRGPELKTFQNDQRKMKASVPPIGRSLAVVPGAIAKKERNASKHVIHGFLVVTQPTPEPSETSDVLRTWCASKLEALVKRLQPAWRDVFVERTRTAVGERRVRADCRCLPRRSHRSPSKAPRFQSYRPTASFRQNARCECKAVI